MKPVIIGDATLFLGDCTDILPTLDIGFDDDGNAIVDHACEPVPTLEIGTPLFLEAACSIVRKPLSNEKISEVIREHMKARALFSPNEFARDIEAAHGIKEAA